MVTANITLTITDKQIKSLRKELKGNGYTVHDVRKMLEILLQSEVNNASFYIFETCLDSGGNNLCGDVLNDEQAKACGASVDEDFEPDDEEED